MVTRIIAKDAAKDVAKEVGNDAAKKIGKVAASVGPAARCCNSIWLKTTSAARP